MPLNECIIRSSTKDNCTWSYITYNHVVNSCCDKTGSFKAEKVIGNKWLRPWKFCPFCGKPIHFDNTPETNLVDRENDHG